MPVQIGQAMAHDFDQPMGMLSDCHRRIERFLDVLVRLARRNGAALGDDERAALEAALHYFRESGPRHTADEEESLFPRLRAIADQDVAAALAEVERLEADHRVAERLHAEVDTLAVSWLRDRALSREAAERFSELTGQLAELYQGHIQVEDGKLFPLAEKALSQPDRAAIGDEMARRRGIAGIAHGSGQS